jgi:L-2-hydroxyglutarate oxidase
MTYDIAIIGSGIVGLSVGYNILEQDPHLNIAIIEKEKEVAFHQTGRNSGVIHSGIYYKPGSAKALNCRKGYDLMLQFCEQHKINYEICGKVIVAANSSEETALKNIYQRGLENGLDGLEMLTAEQLQLKEPHVSGTAAIYVPQAGIVDYKEVAQKLYDILLERNVDFYFENEISNISRLEDSLILNGKQDKIETSFLVNCAGLYSDKIAMMDGIHLGAKVIPFRGEYYLLKEVKKYLVQNLVYPVPNPAFPFLGVHFTRRITGEIDAGPNAVLAFSREGYKKRNIRVNEFLESITYKGFLKVALKFWKVGFYEMYRSFSKRAFTNALKKLIPEIRSADLIKSSSGVRAQLCDDRGNLIDDFLIKYTDKAVHVVNAPSPAATSSLQIGKSIAEGIKNNKPQS